MREQKKNIFYFDTEELPLEKLCQLERFQTEKLVLNGIFEWNKTATKLRTMFLDWLCLVQTHTVLAEFPSIDRQY